MDNYRQVQLEKRIAELEERIRLLEQPRWNATTTLSGGNYTTSPANVAFNQNWTVTA